MGRPLIQITPEICKKAESLAAQGLTMEQIASTLGMGSSTIYEKVNKFSEFSEAIETGRAKGIAQVTNALFKKAVDGDVSAQKYYLNNRDNENWKDRTENRNIHSGSINYTSMTDEELQQELRKTEQELKQSTKD